MAWDGLAWPGIEWDGSVVAICYLLLLLMMYLRQQYNISLNKVAIIYVHSKYIFMMYCLHYLTLLLFNRL